MQIMITGDIISERLTLRCLDESDAADEYRNWMMDPEVNQFLESRFNNPTIDELRAYIRLMRESEHSYLFGICTREDEVHRGNIKLGPISPIHQHAAIGLIIGDKAVWGQGFATEAIGALTKWALSSLGLEKVYAGSYATNRGSIAAFERNGFAVEGVQASHVLLESGERDDVVLLGKLRP